MRSDKIDAHISPSLVTFLSNPFELERKSR